MIRSILWALGILLPVFLIQTTLLGYVNVWGARPNILLLVFVLLTAQNGSFSSQIVGFVLGLGLDSVTGAPLGLNAFVYALAGYLFGLGRGKVYFDPAVMPALLGALSTVYVGVVEYLLNVVFALGQPITAFFHWGLVLQLVMHVILMPALFWVSTWIRERLHNPRRGFGG